MPASVRNIRSRGAMWTCLAALGTLAAGCATPGPSRFVIGAGSGPIEVVAEKRPERAPLDRKVIDEAVAKAVAQRAGKPRPQSRSLEGSDPELKDALALLSRELTGAAYRRVAQAYFELGVLDQADEHYSAALRLDRRDASAYDGRARVWREWHLYGLGLADAARAVYFARGSASAENTRGTLLQAIGDICGARRAYTRAATLDPAATYPGRNIQSLGEGGRQCDQAGAATSVQPGTKRPPGSPEK